MASDDGGVGRPIPAPLRPDPGAVSGAHSSRPAVREARLRPEFAEKYLGIQPGVWFSAAGLAEELITGCSARECPTRSCRIGCSTRPTSSFGAGKTPPPAQIQPGIPAESGLKTISPVSRTSIPLQPA